MPIISPLLEIPQQILDGLATGTYTRYGSIIRSTVTGRIVAHLKDTAVLSAPVIETVLPASIAAGLVVSSALAVVGVGLQVATLRKIDDLGRRINEDIQKFKQEMHDRFSEQALAKLTAGISSLRSALSAGDPGAKTHLASQALHSLSESRSLLAADVKRAVRAEDPDVFNCLNLALYAVHYEYQAARLLEPNNLLDCKMRLVEGLEVLRPELLSLLTMIMDRSHIFLLPVFGGTVDLKCIAWIATCQARMSVPMQDMIISVPAANMMISESRIFELLRSKVAQRILRQGTGQQLSLAQEIPAILRAPSRLESNQTVNTPGPAFIRKITEVLTIKPSSNSPSDAAVVMQVGNALCALATAVELFDRLSGRAQLIHQLENMSATARDEAMAELDSDRGVANYLDIIPVVIFPV
jgi:hypothetical protein